MFNFLRIFSIVSLTAIILVAVFTGMSARNIAIDHLKATIEQNANNLAQGYIHGVWMKYSDVVVPLAASDPAALRNNASARELARDTEHYFQQMNLVRANVYNADGRLLISSNANKQNMLAGSTASPDAMFVSRQFLQGRSIQLLQDVAIRNNAKGTLLQVLVPMRSDDGKDTQGALEILYDISETWQQLIRFQVYGTATVIAIFVVFLGLLFMSSRKAESIIAKQYEANVELAATAEAAQAENQQKSQFLANISHELRTPLNAIIGFSDIIKNEVISALENKKYHDYINDIHSSGVHLLSLINDILDYSKAEAGKLEMEVSEVNATKLVQNSMRLIAPRAETAKVHLTDALPKEQIIMVTDSKKFKQILLNLLSNAVKFTQAGGEVKITAWRDLAADTYYFEVRDTGIGIAPKDISRAMAPFGQVDSTLSRKYEGTGLGLPLTKKFVEIMGGTFAIESELNKGTTITFSLPRELKERDGLIVKQAV